MKAGYQVDGIRRSDHAAASTLLELQIFQLAGRRHEVGAGFDEMECELKVGEKTEDVAIALLLQISGPHLCEHRMSLFGATMMSPEIQPNINPFKRQSRSVCVSQRSQQQYGADTPSGRHGAVRGANPLALTQTNHVL